MELRVNDYVRTKNGQIYKIKDGEEFYEDSVDIGIGIIPDVDGIWIDKTYFQYVDKREIIKTSPNIIDLIEVGDYVNGRIVDDYIYLDKLGLIGLTELEKEDEKFIKSIVTKEQFEAIKYEVN